MRRNVFKEENGCTLNNLYEGQKMLLISVEKRKVFNFVIQLYIIISIVLQNYFSDLYPVKILVLLESSFHADIKKIGIDSRSVKNLL